jgi:putative aldouronate transport system permease protein
MRKQIYQGKDRIFNTVNYGALILIMLSILYPLLYVVGSSFSSPKSILSGKVWLLPVNFSLEGYAAVFKYSGVINGYLNTIFYTVTGTCINIFMTIAAAYALSRKDLVGKNVIMFIFTFTMIFSGGLIPSYMLISRLGMVNTRWVMIIPGAMSVWNVIITRTYYRTTISDELLESAQLDGCSDIKFLLYMVIPLSGAITAVNALFCAVWQWNSFFDAFLYLTDRSLVPLQVVLREILIKNTIDNSMMFDASSYTGKESLREVLKYALIVVASVPVLCIYPLVQKHFVKGVMLGSIKG